MFRKITQLIKWRQARHLVAGFINAEMSSVLRLQPGCSDDDRNRVLASEASLPAIIIGAFPTSGADPGVLASSLKMMESKRAAETADIRNLDKSYSAVNAQLTSTLNGTHLEVTANLDHNRNNIDDIRRRMRSLRRKAVGMTLLGVLLLSGDLVLLYQNLLILIGASGPTDAMSSLAAVVYTLIVVFLLVLLTHLGPAPLFRVLCSVIQSMNKKDLSPPNSISQKIGFAPLIVMLTTVAITIAVSYGVASIRAGITISEGSETLFLGLNTLGLPVLNLFIHICFSAAQTLWASSCTMTSEYFATLKNLSAASREGVRREVLQRKLHPIVRRLDQLETIHRKALRAAYKRCIRDANVRSEISRIADLLVIQAEDVERDRKRSFDDSAESEDENRNTVEQIDPSDDRLVSHSTGSANGSSKAANSIIISALIVACLTPGCSSKNGPARVDALMDNTRDCLRAPGAEAAWQDGFRRINDKIPIMPVGGQINIYTMADTKTYTPQPRLNWVKDMKEGKPIVSARERKRHVDELVSRESSLFEAAKSETVTIQTRMVETVYEVLRSMCDSDKSSPSDVLVVVSDMEPFTDELRTSRVILSDDSMTKSISDVVSAHPPLGANAPHIIVVYKPSIGLLKEKPECLIRLKTFWLSYFKAIGCKQVEWVSPAPNAPLITNTRTTSAVSTGPTFVRADDTTRSRLSP